MRLYDETVICALTTAEFYSLTPRSPLPVHSAHSFLLQQRVYTLNCLAGKRLVVFHIMIRGGVEVNECLFHNNVRVARISEISAPWFQLTHVEWVLIARASAYLRSVKVLNSSCSILVFP